MVNIFFYIYQESREYRTENSPIIYHIDTTNWKIERVLPFENTENKKIIYLKKSEQMEILSNIHKSTLSIILKDFEIVKSDNRYRLIKKQN